MLADTVVTKTIIWKTHANNRIESNNVAFQFVFGRYRHVVNVRAIHTGLCLVIKGVCDDN